MRLPRGPVSHGLVVGALFPALTAPNAFADEKRRDVLKDRLYFYSGIDVARDSYYGWAGTAWAPFSSMDREGFRIRLQGGGGGYRYETSAVAGGWNTGIKIEGEILAGWQFLNGPHALAMYVGANITENRLDQPDPSNRDQGTQAGLKATVEWFYQPDDNWTFTAAANASTADDTASARLTAARRITKHFELGTETAASTDWLEQTAGGGLFIATPLPGPQWRLAGGWRWSSDSRDGPYSTLSFYKPF